MFLIVFDSIDYKKVTNFIDIKEVNVVQIKEIFGNKRKNLSTLDRTISKALKDYDFDYVFYTAEYAMLKAKISPIKYFKDSLTNRWADEYIADKKIKLEIAPLIQWIEAKDNSDALTFDNSIYRIIYANITNDKEALVREINSTMEKLAKLKINLNWFDGKRELVKSLLQPSGWEELSFERLEQIRLDLRELMKHKGARTENFVVFDIKDTGGVIKEVSAGSVLYGGNMEPYDKRVKGAIEEKLKDQIVIHKIRKGEKLTETEVESIYSIFGEDFIYSIDELSSKTDIDKEDVVGIIRKFVGVDEEELNRRFDAFIQSHHSKMNSTQITTLEIIKNDIAKNKGISFAALFSAPYTNFNPNGVEGVFGRMADEVFDLISPFKAIYTVQNNLPMEILC